MTVLTPNTHEATRNVYRALYPRRADVRAVAVSQRNAAFGVTRIMAKHTDLTAEAMEGFTGQECAYLYSSPAWYAYQIGAYFARVHRREPRNVRMGRGYQVHANGMLFAFDARNAITIVE